ncbi:MAG: MarR family transcriptional regulator [Gammaproteobacteria bacterium]|nr:MarR family transcriptional regulator [Gammaproteobacteria bacterium]
MPISAAQIARVRAFNRDYTRRIGVLSEGLLHSPYSLTEVRVMYEISHRSGVTAAELADELELDRGYLSRMLKGFEGKKLLARAPSTQDGRRQHLRLTPAGKRVFASLERRSQEQVGAMLTALDEQHRRAVLGAMEVIQSAFAGSVELGLPSGSDSTAESSERAGVSDATAPIAESRSPNRPASAEVSFRPHRPGDMGWVIHRHGELYWQEYGWTDEFEALVAGITVEFIRNFDPTRERCWIAERGGRRLGCIFLVAKDTTTAKLRLLLVEPEARGLGIGRTLVTECVRFARAAGYEKIVLWTHEALTAARSLYSEAGFKRTAQEPHHSFGHDLVAETWELELRARAA